MRSTTLANGPIGLAFLSKCEAFFLFDFPRVHRGVCLYLRWKHFCEKNDGEGMALKVLFASEDTVNGAFQKEFSEKSRLSL